MSSAFEGEQDREEVASLNALDAEESVGQEENGTKVNAPVETQSVFKDDSDEDADHEDENDIDAAQADQDDSWLGAKDDGDVENNEDHEENEDNSVANQGATDGATSTKRPYDLILDYPSNKRARDADEPEEGPEDQLLPQVSPKTRKRLRTEREHGYRYANRPTSAIQGGQVDSYDPVGAILSAFPPHLIGTLPEYYGPGDRPQGTAGKAMGDMVPVFPYLPQRFSPLGQDTHTDGKWKGLVDVPQLEGEGFSEHPPSPNGSEYGDDSENDDDDEDYDNDDADAPPPRPSTPSPRYDDDDDDVIESQQPDDTSSNNRRDGASSQPSQVNGGDDAQNASSRPRTPSFDELARLQLPQDWADDDDDAAFLSSIAAAQTNPAGTSVDQDAASEGASTADTDSPPQEERQDESEDLITSPSSSSHSDSNSDNDGQSPPRHPSSIEAGREVGQLSQPRSHNPELAQLRLDNAKLKLEHDKCEKTKAEAIAKCEKAKAEAIAKYKELEDDYGVTLDERDAAYKEARRVQRMYAELGDEYRMLRDACLARQQRADEDAQQLARERSAEDVERLALINSLKAENTSLRTWAEVLDAAAEPARVANDDLTAKLETAEQANAELKQQLVAANAQVQEVAAKSLEMAHAYHTLKAANTDTAATPQSASSPSTASTPSTSRTLTPMPTPAAAPTPMSLPFPIAATQETREAREARWRNLGAVRATQDAQREARRDAEAQYATDRELRLLAFEAITGHPYREIEAGQRRRDLMQIVDAHNASERLTKRMGMRQTV